MTETNRPDDFEPPEQSRQSTDEDPAGKGQATDPRAGEVEDLQVADEEISEQVRGGGQRLDQDMDPY